MPLNDMPSDYRHTPCEKIVRTSKEIDELNKTLLTDLQTRPMRKSEHHNRANRNFVEKTWKTDDAEKNYLQWNVGANLAEPLSRIFDFKVPPEKNTLSRQNVNSRLGTVGPKEVCLEEKMLSQDEQLPCPVLGKSKKKNNKIQFKAGVRGTDVTNFLAKATVEDLERYGRKDHISIEQKNTSKYPAMIKRICEIEKANLQLYERLKNVKPLLPTRKQLEREWKKIVEEIKEKAKYPLTISGLVELEDICDDEEYRPRVFMEFGIQNGNILGKIVLSLFFDLMPITVMNFVELCENFQEDMQESRKAEDIKPHLVGSAIQRIFPDLYFEGGDILNDFTSGRSSRGSDFLPENMNVPHSCEGTISMSLTPDGRINSLFAISFRPLEVLNGQRPAFGRVVKGLKLLKIVEGYGTKNGKPKQKIIITRCGLIQPKQT